MPRRCRRAWQSTAYSQGGVIGIGRTPQSTAAAAQQLNKRHAPSTPSHLRTMRCLSLLRAGAFVALLAPALANQVPFADHPDSGRLQWSASDRFDDRDGQHVWCRGDCSEHLAYEDWEQPAPVEVEEEDVESVDYDHEALSFPHPHKPKESNETILGFLATHPGFSRLFKVVNISEEIVSVLNDTSSKYACYRAVLWLSNLSLAASHSLLSRTMRFRAQRTEPEGMAAWWISPQSRI